MQPKAVLVGVVFVLVGVPLSLWVTTMCLSYYTPGDTLKSIILISDVVLILLGGGYFTGLFAPQHETINATAVAVILVTPGFYTLIRHWDRRIAEYSRMLEVSETVAGLHVILAILAIIGLPILGAILRRVQTRTKRKKAI